MKKVTNSKDPIQTTTIPPQADQKTIKGLSTSQLIYSIIGIIVGGAIIFLGIVLLVNIDQGEIEMLAKLFGMHVEVTNAPPGIVVAIIGLFVILITKYSIKS